MRLQRHALTLLVVLGLTLPPGVATGAQPADAAWAPGQSLMRRGDYDAAMAYYADVADHATVPAAPRARLLQARAAIAAQQTDTAEALVQRVLSEFPGWDGTAAAYMTLAQARRAGGDCSGALRALDAFEATPDQPAVGPYAQVFRAQCLDQLGDWSGEWVAAQTGLGIEGGGPRLTRIELYERAAAAAVKLNRQSDALDLYNHALELAGTRGYRAEMLFTTATLARDQGQTALAAERFRAIVVDLPDTARAPGALDALVDLGQAVTISPLQAETVRLQARDDAAVVALGNQVDPASADWGQAQIGKADALSRLGRDSEAETVLESVADAGAPDACTALIALGRLKQRAGETSAAEQSYLRAAQTTSDQVPVAWFGVGFMRYLRGATAEAIAAWGTGLASGPPTPAVQAQLLYWIGKASAAGDSRAAYEAAVRAAPESYYGLRAAEQIGTLSIAATAPAATTNWLTLAPAELTERDAWYASAGLSAQKVAADLAAQASLKRADVLLELGLVTEASWEIDAVQQQYASAHDVAHLNGLADWLTARDLPQLSLRVAKQMRDLVGLNALPRAAQKQVYPAAFGDIVAEQAGAQHLDPLLLLALVRQESSFDPRAQSSAQAMGLTQVVPSTARGIAGRLGRDSFALPDLFKPAVSLEFGAWFLNQLMTQFDGRVFPALAAYNSGGGAVSRWLARYGDDPDVLVEQVPYAETQAYLRIVYDNLWHYRALYDR